MKISLKKDKFNEIDNAFLVLQDKQNDAACKIIASALAQCFDSTFKVTVVKCINSHQPLFVMSVFPTVSTVDKIISSLMSKDKKAPNVIKKLWEQNKFWNIEIDERILRFDTITNKELTSLLLHEVGHIVCSNSIPNRISNIVQYEIAKTTMVNKSVLSDKLFKKILCLPILNACIADDKNKKGLKEELKADSFVKKMGYTKELASALKKLINMSEYNSSNSNKDNNTKQVTNFSTNTVDQLVKREDKIAQKNLEEVQQECVSPFLGEVIQECYDTLFKEFDDTNSFKTKSDFIYERINELTNEDYITEFFIFGGKQLKKIDPAEIDYIQLKIPDIKNSSDKMMLVSYSLSKLDIVNYYIDILRNPRLSRKYNVPHSMDYLLGMKKRLLDLRNQIMNYKIPERTKGLLVAWPDGYDG